METETRVTGSRYFELVRELPLRPLKSEADLDRAVAMMHRLCDIRDMTEDEDDYLHVLGSLISEYEDVHWPMDSDLEERELIRLHREAQVIEPEDDPS
jgi:HTH-type transcriptional regulator/antitoxin HigA